MYQNIRELDVPWEFVCFLRRGLFMNGGRDTSTLMEDRA